jgi:hypothetical protein
MMSLPSARSKSVNASSHSQTVILRNLPNNCSKSKLLDIVGDAGFAGSFDSFHMPVDQDTGANKGYAFFNFKASSTAQVFAAYLNGKRLPGFNSKKVLVVELAHVQSPAQQQFLPVGNLQAETSVNSSLIPAKILLHTLSALPSHLHGFSKECPSLLTSGPVKVTISKLASDRRVFDSSRGLYSSEGYDEEGRTPSISDADSASDDEMQQAKIQFFPVQHRVQLHTIRL